MATRPQPHSLLTLCRYATRGLAFLICFIVFACLWVWRERINIFTFLISLFRSKLSFVRFIFLCVFCFPFSLSNASFFISLSFSPSHSLRHNVWMPADQPTIRSGRQEDGNAVKTYFCSSEGILFPHGVILGALRKHNEEVVCCRWI